MKKAIVIMSVIVTIGCIISIGGAYAATNYAISATNIGYSDNSNLKVDNVQAAIDGTCTKFNTQLTNLKTNIIDTIYPVGSIYTSETDSTATAVQNRFKTFGKDTTWIAYGAGKVLVGSGTGTDANGNSQTFSVSNNNKNLGEYNHFLSQDELPNVHGSFQARQFNNVNILADYDDGKGQVFTYTNNGGSKWNNQPGYNIDATNNNSLITMDFGKNQRHNNIQPYTTVYMYKRTK